MAGKFMIIFLIIVIKCGVIIFSKKFKNETSIFFLYAICGLT